MATIFYKGITYESKCGESLLDLLIREKVPYPYSCRAGVCGACLMRCVEGKVDNSAIAGIKPSLAIQNYFLACQCYPQEKISVVEPEHVGKFKPATVIDKKMITSQICSLQLKEEEALQYRAGQFINVRIKGSDIRSYSIASLPQDGHLELHIKRMPNGIVSNWIADELNTGDSIEIQGPHGECFYLPEHPEASILLIGTGTGLAPLLGIIKDALSQKHQGNLVLCHGEKEAKGLYKHDYLRELQQKNNNFDYKAYVSEGRDSTEYA